MAHLHSCWCGKAFRCENIAHSKSKWYWCDERCPDYWLHGDYSIVDKMDAEFLRMVDEAVRGTEYDSED